jgi:hypothetical protein
MHFIPMQASGYCDKNKTSHALFHEVNMPHPETPSILSRAEMTLQTAKFGLDDLIKGPSERKLAGLSNFITFGRAVTNVLQQLRHKEKGFEEWYAPYEKEMRLDELMKHFYDLRSEILKEGKLGTGAHTHIKSFSFPEDLERLPPPPPNVKGFFMGDQTGGSGWEVELPDGSVEKYYVSIPHDIAESGLHFIKPPTQHLGKKIKDASIENLCILYYEYLRNMIKSAKKTFLA